MAPAARASRRRAPDGSPPSRRFTVDASVFVNAFNPRENGHAASRALLAAIRAAEDPIIVPTLLVTEIASAVARASGDTVGALEYAYAAASLPQVTLVTLTAGMAREAGELAATYRLRGADAVYLAVARRYGTVLVSRDHEQRTRGAAVAACHTPERALKSHPFAGAKA